MPTLIHRIFEGGENMMQIHRQNFIKRDGRVEGEPAQCVILVAFCSDAASSQSTF